MIMHISSIDTIKSSEVINGNDNVCPCMKSEDGELRYATLVKYKSKKSEKGRTILVIL